MNFELTMAQYLHNEVSKKLYEPLGFKFKPYSGTFEHWGDNLVLDNWDHKVTLELNSLEDLLAFVDKYGAIVVDSNWDVVEDIMPEKYLITIYNDYME